MYYCIKLRSAYYILLDYCVDCKYKNNAYYKQDSNFPAFCGPNCYLVKVRMKACLCSRAVLQMSTEGSGSWLSTRMLTKL